VTISDVRQAWSRTNGGVTVSNGGKSAQAKFSEGWQITHSYDATDIELLSATGLPAIHSYKVGTFVPCVGVNIETRGLLFSLIRIDYDKTIQLDPNNPNPDWQQSPLAGRNMSAQAGSVAVPSQAASILNVILALCPPGMAGTIPNAWPSRSIISMSSDSPISKALKVASVPSRTSAVPLVPSIEAAKTRLRFSNVMF